MKKLVLISVVAFGVYKYLFSLEEITSTEYKFEATSSIKPIIKTKINKLPSIGNFKLTTYDMRKDDLFCSITISDYLDKSGPINNIEDTVRPSKRHLIKGFGGAIESSDYVYSGAVKGYEVNLLAKDKKLVKNRIFLYESNTYNLLCSYPEQHVSNVNKFMESFHFI